MRKVLAISGSSRVDSSNRKLLNQLSLMDADTEWEISDLPARLPLFLPELDKDPWPDLVIEWRTSVERSTAVVIATPEYLHNLPALVKNALEWLTTSGELQAKPILPITYTPHPPRGERAMQSLLWSLSALDARIVTSLDLYQSELNLSKGLDSDTEEVLLEALSLLGG